MRGFFTWVGIFGLILLLLAGVAYCVAPFNTTTPAVEASSSQEEITRREIYHDERGGLYEIVIPENGDRCYLWDGNNGQGLSCDFSDATPAP